MAHLITAVQREYRKLGRLTMEREFGKYWPVITGAGSGIGRALALNVADKGARVAISDWNEAGLNETVELLKNAGVAEL